MSSILDFTPDDLFILGSICGASVSAGQGDDVQSIMTFIQAERPDNAGGFVLEALHLHAQDRAHEALDLLIASGALDAASNREEAYAVYALLLLHVGEVEQAYATARDLLDSDSVVSESARQTLAGVIAEIDTIPQPQEH